MRDIEDSTNKQVSGRPLSDVERRVVNHLLSADFAGVAELREQLRGARVLGNWKPDGSPSFDIWLPPDVPRSSFMEHVAPIAASVISADDESYMGEIMLWLAEGKLSGVEYSWVTDDPPTALPDPANIHLLLKK
jgi:hypothetical protein